MRRWHLCFAGTIPPAVPDNHPRHGHPTWLLPKAKSAIRARNHDGHGVQFCQGTSGLEICAFVHLVFAHLCICAFVRLCICAFGTAIEIDFELQCFCNNNVTVIGLQRCSIGVTQNQQIRIHWKTQSWWFVLAFVHLVHFVHLCICAYVHRCICAVVHLCIWHFLSKDKQFHFAFPWLPQPKTQASSEGPCLTSTSTTSLFLSRLRHRLLFWSSTPCFAKYVSAKVSPMSHAQMLKFTNAQMHKCTNAQMHKCLYDNAQLFRMLKFSETCLTNAQMHKCPKCSNSQMLKMLKGLHDKC